VRELNVEAIKAAMVSAIKNIHFHLQPDLQKVLEKAAKEEASFLGRQTLELLLENTHMAASEVYPLCQDTGMTILFVEIGQEVVITGGSLEQALQASVRQATQEGHLRHSITGHPLQRSNTGDNTPAVVHYQIVPGKSFRVQVMAKGGGCENASRLGMLLPAAGQQGILDFVLNAVRENAAASCPPLVMGIGIGGSFDSAPLLAKKALLRKIGAAALDPETAELEKRILEQINRQGIGPQGWGGTTTALSVAIETAPCHIASLPVAVNFDCHSHRVTEVRL
jgi:fumarate hydratase subunit alpha